MNEAQSPPDGARNVMLTLEDGREVIGWYDRHCGYFIRGAGMQVAEIAGWRELKESEMEAL